MRCCVGCRGGHSGAQQCQQSAQFRDALLTAGLHPAQYVGGDVGCRRKDVPRATYADQHHRDRVRDDVVEFTRDRGPLLVRRDRCPLFTLGPLGGGAGPQVVVVPAATA